MDSSDVVKSYVPNSIENSDRTEWAPLTLTLVEYPKGILKTLKQFSHY